MKIEHGMDKACSGMLEKLQAGLTKSEEWQAFAAGMSRVKERIVRPELQRVHEVAEASFKACLKAEKVTALSTVQKSVSEKEHALTHEDASQLIDGWQQLSSEVIDDECKSVVEACHDELLQALLIVLRLDYGSINAELLTVCGRCVEVAQEMAEASLRISGTPGNLCLLFVFLHVQTDLRALGS